MPIIGGTPTQQAYNTAGASLGPHGFNDAGKLASAASSAGASQMASRTDSKLVGQDRSDAVGKADSSQDAARLQGEQMMSRLGETTSMGSKFEAQMALIQQGKSLNTAIAKGIKESGKGVADLA
jgi:hypothetical protein